MEEKQKGISRVSPMPLAYGSCSGTLQDDKLTIGAELASADQNLTRDVTRDWTRS
jgi:hypothetical protein